MSEVRLIGVVKRFGGGAAVSGVSFVARQGEITTLLGPSGCGKTTLLRMIAGLDTPDEGEIWIGDTLVSSPTRGVSVPPNRREIGMVFQSYAIWPHRTVAQNLAYPLEIRGMKRGAIDDRVHEVCRLLRLDGLEARYPSQLSGGQQQRVALGRAIIYEPRLLLLDEPLANLDVKIRETVRFELRSLQAELGFTTIYVTHDQAEAMVLSDNMLVLNKGRVMQEGHPEAVYNQPASRFVADFIGQSNFIEAEVEDVTANMAVLRIPQIGRLKAMLPSGTRLGKVTLCVRPEDLSLRAADGGAPREAEFRGRLRSRAFLGSLALYKVAVGDLQLFVQTDAASDPKITPDAEVIVRIDERRVKVL